MLLVFVLPVFLLYYLIRTIAHFGRKDVRWKTFAIRAAHCLLPILATSGVLAIANSTNPGGCV